MKMLLIALVSLIAIDSFAALTVQVKNSTTNIVKQIDSSKLYLGMDTSRNLILKGFETREEDAVIITPQIALASNYKSLDQMASLINQLKNDNTRLYGLECYEIQGSTAIQFCNLMDIFNKNQLK